MTVVLEIILNIVASVMFILAAVLLLEVTLAAFFRSCEPVRHYPRGRLAILVPAHNESLGISATIRNLKPQLWLHDRLIVIADNCSDDTAAIASAEGAQVIIRSDPTRRGKGFALDFGIRHLEHNPPEIVLIADADCEMSSDSLDLLARTCGRFNRPVQALYLMRALKGADLRMRIAQFAWLIKNQVRPMGLHAAGLPCQLMGTGMAFPWKCISTAILASGHIVEDMKLGADLARAGTSPLFCSDALVTSYFPTSGEGVRTQRTRWEHGHLAVITKEAPRLLLDGILRRDGGLVSMALDLFVPPLALFALLMSLGLACSVTVDVIAGDRTPFLIMSSACASFLWSIVLAWWLCGREVVSIWTLAWAPVYAIRKVPLYARFLVSRQIEWVRSKRDQR